MRAGRNDPCPCGSGKKYKHCCLEADRRAEAEAVATEGPGTDWRLAAGLAAAVVALAAAALAVADRQVATAVLLGGGLLAAIVLVLRRAPPPSGRSRDGHAGIHFGQDHGGVSRPPTRAERRQERRDRRRRRR